MTDYYRITLLFRQIELTICRVLSYQLDMDTTTSCVGTSQSRKQTAGCLSPFLLTKHDLSGRWQTSLRNIDRMVAAGRISKVTLGPRFVRFRLSDVEAAESRHRSKTIMEGLLGAES